MSSKPYFACYFIPLAYFISLALGGHYLWATFVVGFILIPFLDLFMGLDQVNPSAEEEQELKNKFSFKLVTLLWVPLQIAVVLVGAWYVANVPLSTYEFCLVVLGAGLNGGGLGFTISHELCHRKNKLESFASQTILAFVNYMHFHIEHVVGHHLRVATPDDPATARFGESFYQFYPRTVIGSYKSAWEFEAKRVKTRKLSPWKLQNRMVNYLIIQLLITGLISYFFGVLGLVFHIGQSIISFSILEIINYVEHYGLERRKLENGRYEKVQPIHSWNASHRVSNAFLFKLQRHSDHHANANRRYQILRHFEEAPQLPAGYPVMVLMALVPPLFKGIMDPKVKSHRESIA